MKTNRFLAMVLSLCMIFTILPTFTLTASAADATCSTCNTAYNNGFCKCENGYQPAQQISASHHPELNSTHSGYYAIENAGQLYWFAQNVDNAAIGTISQTGGQYNKSTVVEVNAILTDDITDNVSVLAANGEPNSGNFRVYNPIGKFELSSGAVYFNGIFDGNGKTVSGLYSDRYATSSSSVNSGVGLFATTTYSTIKNLTVKDSYFAGYQYVGGISGSHSGKMENCKSYATVKGYEFAGGLCGGIGSTTASAVDCFNYGLVMGASHVGGFAGKIEYSQNINRCGNYGEVRQINGPGCSIGGFVATTNYAPKITNCFNVGDVKYSNPNSNYNFIGGFGADINSGTVENCYTSGAVTVTSNSSKKFRVGGFAGYCSATVSNCYYNSDEVTKDGVTVTAAYDSGSATAATAVTTNDVESGKVCYLLNGSSSADTVVWKQTLATDATPNFDGLIVYYDGTKYYNIVPETEITLTSSDVTIKNLSESATLIVASYNAETNQLIDCKYTTVTGDTTKALGTGGMGLTFSSGNEVKAFLWSNMTDLVPLCESKSVTISATDPFDGEGVLIQQ